MRVNIIARITSKERGPGQPYQGVSTGEREGHLHQRWWEWLGGLFEDKAAYRDRVAHFA